MTLAGMLSRTVVLRRAPVTTDRNGSPSRDWTSATSTTVRGWLAQSTATEIRPGDTGELSTWLLYLPAGTDITADDRVVVDGDVFDVAGPPNRAHTPSGGEHHVEVPLRLVEG